MKKAIFDYKILIGTAIIVVVLIVSTSLINYTKKYRLQSISADFNNAEDFRSGEKYNDALNLYEKVIRADPDNNTAMMGIGYSYLNLGKYEKALDSFNKSLAAGYKKADIIYAFGTTYYLMEDYQNAVSWLREYSMLRPDFNDAFYMLVDTYNALGLHDEAFELLRKRTELNEIDSINPHYTRQMAMSKFLKKEYLEALKYAEMSNKYEDIDSNHLALGAIQLALNKPEMAIKEFEAANRIAASNAALVGLSISYHVLGDQQKSILYMNEAKKYEVHSFSLNFLGFALLNLGQYAKAIEIFNMASADEPDYYLPYKGLAIAYSNLGNKHEALRNIGKAVYLNELDKESKMLLEELRK